MEKGLYICTCIQTEEHKKVFKRCLLSLQRFCPKDVHITVVIDNCNVDVRAMLDENIDAIDNEVPKTGEVYPYYYNWKTSKYHSFIVLHDSMMLIKPLDESIWTHQLPMLPLWSCDYYVRNAWELQDIMKRITDMMQPEIGKSVLRVYNTEGISDKKCCCCDCKTLKGTCKVTRKKGEGGWTIFFGVVCRIKQDFLRHLFSKYALDKVLPTLVTKMDRCAAERLFGILFWEEFKLSSLDVAWNGNISSEMEDINHRKHFHELDYYVNRYAVDKKSMSKTFYNR